MDSRLLPKHVAIIMDGNGRWAQERLRPRIFGHIRGSSRVKEIVREAVRLKIQALTLFAFSTENWKRPNEEIGVLMKLLKKWLIKERQDLMDSKICFRTIGSVAKLPIEVQSILKESEEISKNNEGMVLTFALSYGGREEIADVMRKLAKKVEQGTLRASEISERTLENEFFDAKGVGDPDLLIRTSGEQRISNFLLWQLAYAELYFTSTMWPDFSIGEFQKALISFSGRQRRFGLTSSQVAHDSAH
ncbi:MAG: isoprenyl transferase [Bacteriovoracia bacterium]